MRAANAMSVGWPDPRAARFPPPSSLPNTYTIPIFQRGRPGCWKRCMRNPSCIAALAAATDGPMGACGRRGDRGMQLVRGELF